jgi:hypothetical protein
MALSLNYRRGKSTGNPEVDRILDGIWASLIELDRRTSARGLGAGTAMTVFNDGEGSVDPGLVYGRNSDGVVEAASAAAFGSSVAPRWLALSQAGSGESFEALIVGPGRARVDDGISPSRGQIAWLGSGGLLTNVQPTGSTQRFLCGHFADDTPDDSGLVSVDLFLFPQAGSGV